MRVVVVLVVAWQATIFKIMPASTIRDPSLYLKVTKLQPLARMAWWFP